MNVWNKLLSVFTSPSNAVVVLSNGRVVDDHRCYLLFGNTHVRASYRYIKRQVEISTIGNRKTLQAAGEAQRQAASKNGDRHSPSFSLLFARKKNKRDTSHGACF